MNNKEYILRYQSLIDLMLIYYLKSNFLSKDEAKKTFFDSFKSDDCDHDLSKTKDKILKIKKDIDMIGQEDNEEYLSIKYVMKIFNFNFFDEFCFCFALLYDVDNKYRSIISCINGFDKDGVTIELIIRIFESLGLEYSNLLKNMNDLKMTILGLNNRDNQDKTFYKRVIDILPEIQDNILGFFSQESYLGDIIGSGERKTENEEIIDDIDKYIFEILNRGFYNQRLNVLVIKGRKGSGKKKQIMALASKYNVVFIYVNIRDLCDKNKDEKIRMIRELEVRAYLLGALICFYNFDEKIKEDSRDVFYEIYRYFPLVFVLTEDMDIVLQQMSDEKLLIHSVSIFELSQQERLREWKKHLPEKIFDDEDLEKISRGFVLNIGEIKNICLRYNLVKTLEKDKDSLIIKKLCEDSRDFRFGKLATKVNYNLSFDDIVLNDRCKDKIKEICDRIIYKNQVYLDWGFKRKFPYGNGISALFYGPPGTGKTMAASVIANQVGCELYKIDLSQIVDKYIGETEKNLKNIFDIASKTNVILFFDEADSIFSKRTSVVSSNDKYANVEISYLLQRIEEYEGIVILATNFLSGFDESFKRRIDFMINFSMPDKEKRLQLWKKSFPRETLLSDDIDFSAISEKYELSGSSIKSIAVSAAFSAAKNNSKVDMSHIAIAIRDELEKYGKTFLNMDINIF